jgi:hypothetical protein
LIFIWMLALLRETWREKGGDNLQWQVPSIY